MSTPHMHVDDSEDPSERPAEPGRRHPMDVRSLRRPSAAARCWCWWHAGHGAPGARVGQTGQVGQAGQAGQSTVEYALVLLGAAAVALALVAWVTRSDAVQRLFDAVVGRILSQAG